MRIVTLDREGVDVNLTLRVGLVRLPGPPRRTVVSVDCDGIVKQKNAAHPPLDGGITAASCPGGSAGNVSGFGTPTSPWKASRDARWRSRWAWA